MFITPLKSQEDVYFYKIDRELIAELHHALVGKRHPSLHPHEGPRSGVSESENRLVKILERLMTLDDRWEPCI